MSVLEYINVEYSNKRFISIENVRESVFHGDAASFPEKDGIHILLLCGGEPIACGSAYRCRGDIFELGNIAVEKPFRKKGFGLHIVKLLENEVKKSKGVKLIAEFSAELLPFFERAHLSKCTVAYKKHGKKYLKAEHSFVFEDAEWLGFDGEKEAVIAGRDFLINGKAQTDLYVSGLGFTEIYVNGKSVSDRLYAPAWTNYVSRDIVNTNMPIYDTLTERIMYEKLDITDYLREGKNSIVFHIGGGWFCQHESRNEGMPPYGDITLCFIMKQGDKTILKSDENVRYKKSFVTRASIYFGEKQDARIGGYDFSDTDYDFLIWENAAKINEPLALLCRQSCPPDRVTRHIMPKCIFEKGDYRIYDIGENVAGFPVISFNSDAYTDEICTVRFAETLKSDGSLNFHYSGGAWRMQRDEYIYDNKCREFYPHFTWHGARYFDVTGNAKVIDYCVAHTDIKKIVDFKSSEPTLQWIFDSYIRTQLNNIHTCVPSDCPHRERLGYTGDGQLASRAVMTCFDAKEMYRKWMKDVADCQDIYGGHVQHTAPFYGGGGGPGGWGGAIVFVPYNFYEFYGEKAILKEYYPNMLLYLDYLYSHSENGLVVKEETGGWCLGDWCSPGNKNLIPEPFVNTYFHLKALKEVIEVAKILGESTAELSTRLEEIVKAFVAAFYDESSGTFCKSSEAADAYGFDLGLGDERTLKAIVAKYESLGEFDTGIFGTDILIRVLCETGNTELAKKLLTSKKENTFYNMQSQGATTLWENWDGCDSHDHPMFGAVVEYLVKYFNEI